MILDGIFLLFALVASLIIESAVQVLVSLRQLKNIALSFLE